jgi:hypothetical protein
MVWNNGYYVSVRWWYEVCLMVWNNGYYVSVRWWYEVCLMVWNNGYYVSVRWWYDRGSDVSGIHARNAISWTFQSFSLAGICISTSLTYCMKWSDGAKKSFDGSLLVSCVPLLSIIKFFLCLSSSSKKVPSTIGLYGWSSPCILRQSLVWGGNSIFLIFNSVMDNILSILLRATIDKYFFKV